MPDAVYAGIRLPQGTASSTGRHPRASVLAGISAQEGRLAGVRANMRRLAALACLQMGALAFLDSVLSLLKLDKQPRLARSP